MKYSRKWYVLDKVADKIANNKPLSDNANYSKILFGRIFPVLSTRIVGDIRIGLIYWGSLCIRMVDIQLAMQDKSKQKGFLFVRLTRKPLYSYVHLREYHGHGHV